MSIVNNRPVRCPVTLKALDYAFADLIPKGKHPIGVVTITIDPKEVDVNIHPTKKEVKYSNGSDVYSAVHHALKEALMNSRQPLENVPRELERAVMAAATAPAVEGSAMVRESTVAPMIPPTVPPEANPRSTYQRLQQLSLRDRLPYQPAPQPTVRSSSISDPISQSKPQPPATLPPGWRTIGYLHNTYMLVQTTEGLEIVEQHIAHERVIYERLLAQQKTRGRISENAQKLVLSAPLNLTAEQRACLVENIEVLKGLGFDFDVQGDQVACTQVPLELATKDYVGSVQANVEKLLVTGTADFQLEATKSLACQSAIKNGMPLSETEIVELLSEWDKCPRNDTCPHGRPIALRFSKEKLFDMFHPD
jgi:DNA mismatch repair protein MutL